MPIFSDAVTATMKKNSTLIIRRNEEMIGPSRREQIRLEKEKLSTDMI